MKYISQPKEIEAFQWMQKNQTEFLKWVASFGDEVGKYFNIKGEGDTVAITIKISNLSVKIGDYIVRSDEHSINYDTLSFEFFEMIYKPGTIQDASDGYHTFKELYDHRIQLWIALCRVINGDKSHIRTRVWRSELHSDGSKFEGWFVLGITTDMGKVLTYHLPMDKWDECDFAYVYERGEYDGHTSADVLNRLKTL